MVFSSIEFIFRFLIVFLIIYFLTPNRYKNAVLLLASLVFYAFGEPKYVIVMIGSIVVNYYISLKMDQSEKRKKWLILALVIDIGILFVFKYANFFIDNVNALADRELISNVDISLPIGISFYTFQIISYVVDVYRKKYSPAKKILPFATYVSMFPQLIAGPIVNYNEVSNELRRRRVTWKDLEVGCVAFIIGLTYKVLLANQMGTLWNSIQTAGVYGITTPVAWIGAWGYSFQLYFDFAGYSMMAIGLGRIMGFYIPINFADPYISKSATEFWRRWHITLGRWFREYVYIPLGGNRKGKIRTIANLFIVWALTGLWHGASWNFVVWGLTFFVLLMIEKMFIYKFLDKSKIIGHVYMLILIPITWIIFAITDLKDAVIYIAKMLFIPIKGMAQINGADLLGKYLGSYWWLLLICAVCATPLPMKIIDKYFNTIIVKIFLLIMFWLCVSQLLTTGENPFLYFRF